MKHVILFIMGLMIGITIAYISCYYANKDKTDNGNGDQKYYLKAV